MCEFFLIILISLTNTQYLIIPFDQTLTNAKNFMREFLYEMLCLCFSKF